MENQDSKLFGDFFLVACMPKSGSTHLVRVISELPGMRKAVLVPGFERREQELEAAAIARQVEKIQPAHRLSERNRFFRGLWKRNKLDDIDHPRGWVAQNHTRFSQTTAKYLEHYNIRPIVLVRNIYDVVPSLYDHLSGQAEFIKKGDFPRGSEQNMSMAYVAEDARKYDRDTFIEFIAEMVIPWYFNFYASWTKCHEATLVTYEQIRSAPVQTLEQVFKPLKNPFTTAQIETALERASKGKTRMNKGHAGRGGELPEHIREKIASYARFYPGIDFSPIGLGNSDDAKRSDLKRIGGG